MSEFQTTTPEIERTESRAIATYYARDIALRPEYHELWMSESGIQSDGISNAGLPAGGFASPMGFWFYPATTPEAPGDTYQIVVRERAERTSALNALPRRTVRGRRLTRTVTYKGKEGEITLVVGQDSAQVFTSRPAWEQLSEAVFLMVAQYWQYCVIEARLSHLAKLARQDRSHAIMPRMKTWINQKTLLANDRAVQDLLQDWSYFAGMLSDPAHYSTSESTIEAYLDFAEHLDMEGWSERIDDRFEVVEGTYEMVTEKLFHYKMAIWSLVLEIVIIAIIAHSYLAPAE